MTEHMKVRGIKPRIQYIANGVLRKYEFPFVIFKTSDVSVYFDDVLQDISTYTVSEPKNSLGGSITFETAPQKDVVVTICRKLSIERTTDFQPGSSLRADVLNDEFDYQIACQQQIADDLNRSMVLPPYVSDTDVDLTLPTPSSGKAIVWSSDGTKLENSTLKVNELEKTIKGYKTEAQIAATTATQKANEAISQVQTATAQARIASSKATEAISAASQLNNMRTNCITEIPQNIKFELNNGILTLKSGSKVYIPNGIDVFDSVTITNDITTTRTDSQKCMVCYNRYENNLRVFPITLFYSGDVEPNQSLYMFWYDTINNKCKITSNSGTTWEDGMSFPLALVTTDGNKISSIEQVFNGFGYIASTIFVLPGVKGLIPNGRNADGTMNNIEVSVNNVITRTGFGANRSNYGVSVYYSSAHLNYDSCYRYIEDKNILYPKNADNKRLDLEFATFSTDGSEVITSFKPKTVFRAMDYIDKSTIIKWGMPDYSAGISVGSGDIMTLPCFVRIAPIWNGQDAELTKPFAQSLAKNIYNGSNKFENSACFICDKGETISFTNATCYAYPLKGV